MGMYNATKDFFSPPVEGFGCSHSRQKGSFTIALLKIIRTCDESLRRGDRFVVIGGGFIGSEVAAARVRVEHEDNAFVRSWL